MIASLHGKLIHKRGNEIILNVNGVGYLVFISRKVSENLPAMHDECTVITHLDVKENSLNLYGFIDEKEREIFRLLLSVSGIGPKLAHTVLTSLTFEEIISMITNRSFASGVKIPGVGSKKLELISMTLKDKIYKIDKDIDISQGGEAGSVPGDHSRLEALNALMNLGYMRSEGEKIIKEVLKNSETTRLSTEEIIRKSLEYISK